MSGKLRCVLDTNAVVSLLNGNRDLATRLEAATYVGISVVTYLEFLAFEGLTPADRKHFQQFCSRIEIVPLVHNDKLAESALTLRTLHRLKLPTLRLPERRLLPLYLDDPIPDGMSMCS